MLKGFKILLNVIIFPVAAAQPATAAPAPIASATPQPAAAEPVPAAAAAKTIAVNCVYPYGGSTTTIFDFDRKTAEGNPADFSDTRITWKEGRGFTDYMSFDRYTLRLTINGPGGQLTVPCSIVHKQF